MLRKLLLMICVLFLILFVSTGIGWIIAHVVQVYGSSPTPTQEFLYPWNNHGSTLYMTSRQKYWIDTFDQLSAWSFVTWLLFFASWVDLEFDSALPSATVLAEMCSGR